VADAHGSGARCRVSNYHRRHLTNQVVPAYQAPSLVSHVPVHHQWSLANHRSDTLHDFMQRIALSAIVSPSARPIRNPASVSFLGPIEIDVVALLSHHLSISLPISARQHLRELDNSVRWLWW
jgi:hypothetical protein